MIVWVEYKGKEGKEQSSTDRADRYNAGKKQDAEPRDQKQEEHLGHKS